MPKPYTVQDRFFKKAKDEGYRARSVYKLQEIQEKFKLVKPGNVVLDLGAAPGSFSQYASRIASKSGAILALDLQEIEPFEEGNIYPRVCDITDEILVKQTILSFFEQINGTREKPKTHFDVVITDIAPKTTGVKDVDQWHSIELNQEIVEIAGRWLRTGGNLLMKVFQGADFDDFLREVKKKYKKVKVCKPKAVRDRSFEVYVVCTSKI